MGSGENEAAERRASEPAFSLTVPTARPYNPGEFRLPLRIPTEEETYESW